MHARAGLHRQGAPVCRKGAHLRRVCARRAPLPVRAEQENPFAKLGTQLAKAGTTFTETIRTLTGTTRVGKRVVVDENVVFVAGATGRLGARIVKQCLAAGFIVRAGVRSMDKGKELISTAKQYGVLSPDEEKRLQLVEYDLFEEGTIAPALGNAGVVVCAIGAAESEVLNVKGPQKVDGEAAIRLVDKAKANGVRRFLMVTSLGTTKFGWPASVLNLFWGVLYWKKQAEEALIKSGMQYTIIRPGGMERPTDEYKNTHNLVVSGRDTTFGGNVSRLQVAELTAAAVATPELAANKTLEVTASENAELLDFEGYLASIPVDISVEEMGARQAEIADVRNRVAVLSDEAEELEAQLAEREETKVNAEKRFATARSELQSVRSESMAQINEADEAAATVERLTEQLDAARRQESAAKAVLSAQQRAARGNELLSQADISGIAEPILNPSDEGADSGQGAPKGGLLGAVFGGGQAKPSEVTAELVEEVAEDVVEAAPKSAGFGFGLANPAALFGGSKQKGGAGDTEAQPQDKGQEPSVAAPQPSDDAPPSRPTKAKTTKGGGLFGMFQQDTVYADEPEASSADSAVQEAVPEPEAAPRKAPSKRKSVKELVPRKSAQGQAQVNATSDESSSAALGASSGSDDAAPKPAAPAKPSSPAPAKQAAESLETKRKAAVEAALKNLGAAREAASEGAEAAKSSAKAAVAVAERPKEATSEEPATVPAESSNGVPQPDVPENVAEARAWIEKWRAQQ